MTNLPAFMTTKQAAAYLGVEVQTLANWRVKGKGPRFIRRPQDMRIMYLLSDLDAWKAIPLPA